MAILTLECGCRGALFCCAYHREPDEDVYDYGDDEGWRILQPSFVYSCYEQGHVIMKVLMPCKEHRDQADGSYTEATQNRRGIGGLFFEAKDLPEVREFFELEGIGPPRRDSA